MKLDSTTIHGIAVIAAGVLGVLASAAGVVAQGGTAQAGVIAAVYGLLHIFLPQNPE